MSNNALHNAAYEGNLAEVQAQVGNFDINAMGGILGETALFKAAENGHTEVVKLLLSLNPPPDVNMPNVSTPTMMSVYLICISHFACLYYTLFPAPPGMCCYHV